jgi:hypothetical protein
MGGDRLGELSAVDHRNRASARMGPVRAVGAETEEMT